MTIVQGYTNPNDTTTLRPLKLNAAGGIDVGGDVGFTDAALQDLSTVDLNMQRLNTGDDRVGVGLDNGTTFDTEESNIERALVTVTGQTTTWNSSLLQNKTHRGTRFAINITAITGVTLTCRVETPYAAGTQWLTLAQVTGLTAVSAAGTPTVIEVCPGISAAAGRASDILPRSYRLTIAITAGTGSFSCTIDEALQR